jgi:hypothetical protein
MYVHILFIFIYIYTRKIRVDTAFCSRSILAWYYQRLIFQTFSLQVGGGTIHLIRWWICSVQSHSRSKFISKNASTLSWSVVNFTGIQSRCSDSFAFDVLTFATVVGNRTVVVIILLTPFGYDPLKCDPLSKKSLSSVEFTGI